MADRVPELKSLGFRYTAIVLSIALTIVLTTFKFARDDNDYWRIAVGYSDAGKGHLI
jgi:hypothetical protein